MAKQHKNWHQKAEDQLSPADKVADRITTFAGTVPFIYLHIIWWGAWFLINASFLHLQFDKYPYNLLTMILSLESILLATLIMISQNRQAGRDKIQAEHQEQHQEKELRDNINLTKQVHALTQQIHYHLGIDQDNPSNKTGS